MSKSGILHQSTGLAEKTITTPDEGRKRWTVRLDFRNVSASKSFLVLRDLGHDEHVVDRAVRPTVETTISMWTTPEISYVYSP